MGKKRTAKSYIPKEGQALLKGSGVKVRFHNNRNGRETKYTKAMFIDVYKGYDAFENLIAVRSYIQKRYNISISMLEVLLKLMGMRVFTRANYKDLPKKFTYSRFKRLIDEDFITLVMKHSDPNENIYCLSERSRKIVVKFYEYLSGEVPIPEYYQANEMAKKKNPNAWDRKKFEIIKQMNRSEISNSKRGLFE